MHQSGMPHQTSLPISVIMAIGFSFHPGRAAPPVIIPAEDKVLATLAPTHPRILIRQSGLDSLKQRIANDPSTAARYKAVKARADSALTEPVMKHEKPDKLRMPTNLLRERMTALGMVHLIEGGARYADRAWKELSAISAFPDWNTSHFLDAAGFMYSAGIGYDWFHGAWSAAQRDTVRKAILAKGLIPARNHYKAKSGFVTLSNNWNHVCNGGVILAALAIADVDTSGVARYDLVEAMRSMEASGAMDAWDPDGGWVEGPGYWGYLIEYTAQALAALQSGLGTSFGFEGKPGLSQTGYFPIYMTGPAGKAFNFADGGELPAGNAGLFWMAKAFDHPEFAGYQRSLKGNLVTTLLWDTGPAVSPAEARLPLDRVFRKVEAATFRSAWGDTGAAFLGFKAGRPGDSHGHMDQGSFVLDALGVRWAGDLGAENYNLPNFWDGAKGRWEYYRNRAEGHNTLVIDPTALPQQVTGVRTALSAFTSDSATGSVIADLTPAYAGKATRYRRGAALMRKRGWFLIQDEVEGARAAETWWFLHTRAQIRLDGAGAYLEQDGKRLWARILSPASARFSTREAAPLPGTPNPAGQTPNVDWRKLCIRFDSLGTGPLSVLFVPLRPGETPPSALPQVRPLGTGWPEAPVAAHPSLRPAGNLRCWWTGAGLRVDAPGGGIQRIRIHTLGGRLVTSLDGNGPSLVPGLAAGAYRITAEKEGRIVAASLALVP